MMNPPIEGVVIAARLKAGAFGQSRYDGVSVRQSDGAAHDIGSVMVPVALGDVLAPGTRGRFYFHDIMGSQGLHGFKAADAPVRIAFPMLVERIFALLALLNLVVVAGWLGLDGALQLVPLMLGVTATAAWAACRGSREAVLHDFRYENRMTAARSHRQAVLGRAA